MAIPRVKRSAHEHLANSNPIIGPDAALSGADAVAARAGAPRAWRHAAWAVADQVLFAGSNFLLNVVLIRALVPADYGAFTLGYAIVWLLGSAHGALLIEPMLVFGPGAYRDRTGAYLAALVCGHALLVIPAGLAMMAAGWVCWLFGNAPLGTALWAFCFNGPLVLLLWFARRACYVRLEPQKAAVAGGLYLAAILVGVLLLQRTNALSVGSAVWLLGLSSLAVALGLLVSLAPDFQALSPGLIRDVMSEHLRFGRWGVGSGLLFFASGQLFYMLLAAFNGLHATGALRAAVNLLTPMTLVSHACASVMAPTLVRGAAATSEPAVRRRVGHVLGSLLGGCTAYWLLLGLLHVPLFRVVYAGRYAEHAWLLWLVGLTMLTTAIVDVLSAALRARHQPTLVFRAFAAAAGVALVGGTVAVCLWGAPGAAAGLVACGCTAAGVLLRSFNREVPRTPARGADGTGTTTGLPMEPVQEVRGF